MSNLNNSSWYNPGFNAVSAPRKSAQIAVSALGAFTVKLFNLKSGETAPSKLYGVLMSLEGELLDAFLHLEWIETVSKQDSSTDPRCTVDTRHSR